jgi:hypothetical protein
MSIDLLQPSNGQVFYGIRHKKQSWGNHLRIINQTNTNQPNMNNLKIEATSSTPAIQFKRDGRMLIEGRSLPENVQKFYDPLMDWAKKINAEAVKLDINMEYLNSASTKKILEFLKILDANNCIKTFIVNWHYETDDEDTLENGQIFEELLRKAQFRYLEYSEAC